MSGTRSPSKTAPATEGLWRLSAILWPFATGAVAINLFLLGLLWQPLGLAPLSPLSALVWSLPLGLPATWAAAVWVRHLIREAEGPSRAMPGSMQGEDFARPNPCAAQTNSDS
jgi:hypothetical protein